jgi:hypothetical protein
MKKLTFILLMAAMALPLMAQMKGEEPARGEFRRAANPQMVTTLQPKHALVSPALRGDVPDGYASVTLTAGNVWDDGTGYQMLLDADATAYGTIIPTTGGLTSGGDASAATYAEFEYKIPENADGALTTSNIVINNTVTILIPAGVYDFCITNPTPDDRVWIASEQGNVGGRADDFEFVSGGTYIFTVTLSGQNDRVDLEIIDPNAPVLPVNVTVDPTATTAGIAWENDHDQVFNLRYRVYTPNAAQNLTYDFETEDQLEGWMSYDYDEDGNAWQLYYDQYGYGRCHSGDYALASYSYISGTGAVTPDNWLISPEINLGGTLKFWAGPYSTYYPGDVFAVYVTTGDPDDINSYVKISEDLTAPEWTEFTFDLSQYNGAGHFAIRHYNVSDEWALMIDDVNIEVPGDEVAEWIYVEGVQGTDFNIEGLAPETTYEVQVQAVSADGRTSKWTESTIFTTLAGGEEPTEMCLAPNSGYEITGVETATVTITNREEGATVVYDVYCNDELVDNGSFTGESYSFVVTGDGNYVVHAIATMPGKLNSPDGGVFFTILEGEGPVGIDELAGGKQVAGVRYYNALGQEMQEANGMTIVVTTYTDGTTSTAKVVK